MRGQVHTLEGFVASMVVLSGVVFALQATAVTPLTASTSNQFIQNQQRAVGGGVLAAADGNDSLKEATLYWNASEGAFKDTGERDAYATGGPPLPFGKALNETFSDARIAFNVDVFYRTADEERGEVEMVQMGTPSNNAIAATQTVPLFDDDTLTGSDRTVAAVASDPDEEFYASDIDPDGELFNVLEVRIVVWRI
jgi:hypothetical protein